jgi:signal transduction histidine kinase
LTDQATAPQGEAIALEPSAPGRPQDRSSGLSPDEMVAVFRAFPHGGVDEAARSLALPPQVRATISPMINALRWAAVMYGMIFGANEVFQGHFEVVTTLTVCLFLTTWRTMIPIRLGSTATTDRTTAFTDALMIGLAVGHSGGPTSPYVFCVTGALVVASFGWGYVAAAGAFAAGWLGIFVGNIVAPAADRIVLGRQLGLIAGSMIATSLIAAFVRDRLLDAERRRASLAGRLDRLAETNDLLTMLNSVARTLPTSLNQREAIEGVRQQIVTTFKANVICLLELDETHEEWVPKLAEGCVLKPTSSTSELSDHLQTALDADEPVVSSKLRQGTSGIAPGSGSGMYTRLVARGRTVGVLGIEHPAEEQFGDRDRTVLNGLADVLALTLDNARWFGRLRSLGAEEERVRIARDLHDRLGQWLTYISFELERIISTDDTPVPELDQLYQDVQTALDELRETLRQLRSGVTEQRSLGMVGRELADRFAERTDIDVTFSVTHPDQRLPVPVENELLRIMQEALNNIDKHAKASRVDVKWDVDAGRGVLTIHDNGRGFDAAQGVRDSAYGLVGMRERADVIGGRLSITSALGEGTTITVSAGSMSTKED